MISGPMHSRVAHADGQRQVHALEVSVGREDGVTRCFLENGQTGVARGTAQSDDWQEGWCSGPTRALEPSGDCAARVKQQIGPVRDDAIHAHDPDEMTHVFGHFIDRPRNHLAAPAPLAWRQRRSHRAHGSTATRLERRPDEPSRGTVPEACVEWRGPSRPHQGIGATDIVQVGLLLAQAHASAVSGARLCGPFAACASQMTESTDPPRPGPPRRTTASKARTIVSTSEAVSSGRSGRILVSILKRSAACRPRALTMANKSASRGIRVSGPRPPGPA